jgi:hypothetical protein
MYTISTKYFTLISPSRETPATISIDYRLTTDIKFDIHMILIVQYIILTSISHREYSGYSL